MIDKYESTVTPEMVQELQDQLKNEKSLISVMRKDHYYLYSQNKELYARLRSTEEALHAANNALQLFFNIERYAAEGDKVIVPREEWMQAMYRAQQILGKVEEEA